MLAMRVRDSRGGADPQGGVQRDTQSPHCKFRAEEWGAGEMTGPDLGGTV